MVDFCNGHFRIKYAHIQRDEKKNEEKHAFVFHNIYKKTITKEKKQTIAYSTSQRPLKKSVRRF